MSMPDATKNAMLDHLATLASHASAHSAFPGTTGANELTGGTPAYARKPITWAAAAGGVLSASDQPQFDVGAGTTVAWFGFWSAVAAGTFRWCTPRGGTPMEMAVDITGNLIEAVGHGLSNDEKAVIFDGTPPAPIVEGTEYFVVNAAADTLQLALTQGGAAIDLTTVGDLRVKLSRIVPEVNAGQNTDTITSATLSLNL